MKKYYCQIKMYTGDELHIVVVAETALKAREEVNTQAKTVFSLLNVEKTIISEMVCGGDNENTGD